MVFGAASCQKDMANRKGESTVSFSVEIPDEVVTKADISDGTAVNQLIYEVYVGSEMKLEGAVDIETAGSRKFVLELNLVTGLKYDLLFWAQTKGTDFYDVSDLRRVRAHYYNDRKFANEEKRDAFCGARIGFEATGIATSETIKLHRPFAQINFGSSPRDWESAKEFVKHNGLRSSVTIKDVPVHFSVLTGDICTENVWPIYEDITFDYSLCPASEDKDGKNDFDKEYIRYNDTNYAWIAMNYIFGSKNEGVLSNVKAYFIHDENDENTALAKEVINVPFKQNYRTNILGEIFTGGNKFTVVIEPGFENDPIENYPDYILAEPIFFAFENGGTVTLTDNVTLPANIRTNKDVTINLNGKTITYKSFNGTSESMIMARIEEGGRLTINGPGAIVSNGYIASANAGSKIFVNGGNFSASATAFQANGGEVYLLGGTYEENTVPSDPTYLVNMIDGARGSSTISISGGTYKGFNPGNNLAEGENTNFLAIGYKSVDNGDGTYTVQAEPHQYITFMRNVKTATSLNVTKFDTDGRTVYADFTSTSSKYIVDAQNAGDIGNFALVGSNKRNSNDEVLTGIFISNTANNVNLYRIGISGVAYAINTGSGISAEANLNVSDCLFHGITRVASFNSVKFSGTQFKKGSFFTSFEDPYMNGCLNVAINTVLEMCTFDKDFHISLANLPETSTITFKNCSVNDVKLTATNVHEYLKEVEEGTLARIIFENN